jgi:hypothetical protein
MSLKPRRALGIWVLVGLLLAVGGIVWWQQGPSEDQVRRTVVTTVQEEAPASFLVTGTLDIHVTVAIDSSQYATPGWITSVLTYGQPGLLTMLKGSSQTTVRVPGRVSYGFDVRTLDPKMIAVKDDGRVAVDLPELSIHSVEPDLSKLKVRTSTSGWMRVFPSEVRGEVRKRALAGVKEAFQRQARRRIETATQPRVNTARALEKMLTPPLKAAGVKDPKFRIRVGDRLSLTPEEEGG